MHPYSTGTGESKNRKMSMDGADIASFPGFITFRRLYHVRLNAIKPGTRLVLTLISYTNSWLLITPVSQVCLYLQSIVKNLLPYNVLLLQSSHKAQQTAHSWRVYVMKVKVFTSVCNYTCSNHVLGLIILLQLAILSVAMLLHPLLDLRVTLPAWATQLTPEA